MFFLMYHCLHPFLSSPVVASSGIRVKFCLTFQAREGTVEWCALNGGNAPPTRISSEGGGKGVVVVES